VHKLLEEKKPKIFAWPDFSSFPPLFLSICHYHGRHVLALFVNFCVAARHSKLRQSQSKQKQTEAAAEAL